jgi:hypothetical protein
VEKAFDVVRTAAWEREAERYLALIERLARDGGGAAVRGGS